MFFALKGDKFDGHAFALKALEQGAAYSVIDNPDFQTDPRCLLVVDVLVALQQLARHHRRQFQIPVVAIGGSNGKTTTKELVSAVLSSHYPCHFTKGNFNNHIGVPLTLLAMPAETEVAIIEMGANHPGDIAELCAIAEPTHGLVTNIGKEHLEGFGSLEGVKKAEGELYDYLAQQKGVAFVNRSERYLAGMARANRQKIRYGATDNLWPDADGIIEAQLLRATPAIELAFLSETEQPIEARSHLFGRHNFFNLLTAVALGTYFKVPAEKIKTAFEQYIPANNRSQIVQRGANTFIMDAYNANPSSMKAALQSFKEMEARHKVAILGDMLELGPDSQAEHEATLRLARRAKLDQIVLVGAEFGRCALPKKGVVHFPDTAAAKVWFDAQHFQDTLLLVKGSRGIRLEGLLTTPSPDTPAPAAGQTAHGTSDQTK